MEPQLKPDEIRQQASRLVGLVSELVAIENELTAPEFANIVYQAGRLAREVATVLMASKSVRVAIFAKEEL